MYNWDTKLKYVRGLGPTRSHELAKIGIETVGQLLERQPLSYIFPGVTSIADASEGTVVIKATIKSIKRTYGSTVEAVLDDGSGTCRAIWYGGAYLLQSLRPGMVAIFYGKYKGWMMQQPRWTYTESTMANVYGGIYGTHHKTIRAALIEVLGNVQLPGVYDGDSRVALFRAFHFPASKDEQGWALATLKLDECLQLQLALAERRAGRAAVKGVVIEFGDEALPYFPYQFTGDQEKAIAQVREGLASGHVLNLLIHGEVSSGKSAIMFYAAIGCALQGHRAVILAPTSILAQQHYDNLKGLGWGWDIQLTIKSGQDDGSSITVGTHAILNDESILSSAALVCCDEVQKFGVQQRASIHKSSHLLILSATPIPRSLAMTVFGDLGVATLRELPIKRGLVITKQVLPDRKEAMYEIIEKELAAGHQAYVVYPRINEGVTEDEYSAIQGNEAMHARFPDKFVTMLTGSFSAEEKAKTLQRFREGKIDILVSTIIAEVGLDNSNATVMCIMGADRFGLSQLHQLRGRVCRSTSTAFCFLVSETANPTSIARLEAIERCNDGFEIAEEDLRLRGAGEVFSTKQHGLPDLNWCSLVDDFDLMQEARDLVQSGGVGSGVREMVALRYGTNLNFGGVV